MTLTRKQHKRTTPQGKQKPRRTAPDTRDVIERIDAMIRELQALRQELATMPRVQPGSNVTEELFGALGHGTWEEYDLSLD